MSNDAGVMPGRRPRHVTARGTVRSSLRALAVLLLACLAGLGVAPAAGAADGDGLIKVFVVQDPAQTGGRLPTLQSIAAGTLGDPSRSTEIFELNRGQAQQDGVALNSPGDQLHPGWILRLPQDATGPGVQLARDTGGQSPSAAPTGASGAAPPGGGGAVTGGTTTVFAIPLATVVAVLGAVLLALVTAGIVGRRKVRAASAAVGRAVGRLGEPMRRRRRYLARRAVGRRFAADTDSVRRAYDTLGAFAATRQRPETPVHALRVDSLGVTVWLPASDTVGAPWLNIDTTRWRLPAAAPGLPQPGPGLSQPASGPHQPGSGLPHPASGLSQPGPGPSQPGPGPSQSASDLRQPGLALSQSASGLSQPGLGGAGTGTGTVMGTTGQGQTSAPAACLVRVGTDADGETVFVDLSRLDGVLSVTGESAVARDVVQNLLGEIARTRPDTPVTVLGDRGGALPLAVPPGLRQLPPTSAPAPTAPPTVHGTVRAAAARRPVRGLVVLADTPTEREAAELAALCGPGGAGWTGLVCGDAGGAHWQWHADADGQVDIPVLDVRLTVPA